MADNILMKYSDKAGILLLSLGMDKAAAARRLRELDVLNDRDRIARDLHDHVIQRIFAAGLTLRSVAGRFARAFDPNDREGLARSLHRFVAHLHSK